MSSAQQLGTDMMTASKKMIAAASAAAISSAGLLVCPPLALAEPCKQYGFDGRVQIIEEGTGWEVGFTSIGTVTSGRADAVNYKTGETQRIGNLTGGFTSPTDLSLTIQYPEGTQVYRGAVGSDGRAHGVTAQPPFDGIKWYSQLPLTCLDEVGAPRQGPQQPPPPPPPPPPPEQAPTNAITVNFADVPGGLIVNVGNLANIAATCTYDATAPNSLIPPIHRDFTMGPTGAASFQISGIRTGTQYNTVTVCRGNFQGKDVEIGRVALTKSF